MPELPEVETVRRGLAPAMEDARFSKVEVRRPDLRWPLPPGEEAYADIASRPGVVHMNGAEILDWYEAVRVA